MNKVTETTIKIFSSVTWLSVNGGCLTNGILILYPKLGSTSIWGIAPSPNSNLTISQNTYNSIIKGKINIDGSYQDHSNSLGNGSNVNYYLIDDNNGSCISQKI